MPDPIRKIFRVSNSYGYNADENEAPVKFHSGEKVRLTVEVRNGNEVVNLPDDYTVKWQAWLADTPATLYIDKTGSIENGRAVVELTPDESAMDDATYDYEVRIYSGTTDMGVVLYGRDADGNGLEVLYAVPTAGVSFVGTSHAYPDTLSELADVESTVVPTVGKLLVGTGTKWNTISVGTSGQVLTSNGTTAAWASPTGVADGDKGDITVSASGATWTIDNDAVTLSQMAHMATNSLIGRHAAGTGNPQVVGIDGGLELSGGNLRRSALSGDVTASAGSGTTSITDAAVANAKLANMAQSTVKGRAASAGTGVPVDLTPAQLAGVLSDQATLTLSSATVAIQNSATVGDSLEVGTDCTAGQFIGAGGSLTALNATQLTTGTVPAARLGNVNHRVFWSSVEAFLTTSANVGWSQYNHASRAISLYAAKSATASLQSATLRFPAKRVPFGFAAFKTTGAITLKYLGDSTSSSDIKITGITLYGTDLTTGSETTLYTDSTARTPGTANAVIGVSLDRSAFSSTTVPEYLIIEVSVQVANSKSLGVVAVEVNAE